MVLAAQSDTGDLLVVYIPDGGQLGLRLDSLRTDLRAEWINPANGEHMEATSTGSVEHAVFETPAPGDWVLVLKRGAI